MAKPKLYDFEVKNRWTGEVQFTSKIEADPSVPLGIRLGFAVRWALDNGANLRYANLRYADLIGACLSDASLSGADLRNASLRGADLRGVALSGANLSGASLRYANLRYADLSGACLRNADLSGASLRGANLRGEKIARIFAQIEREIDPYTFMGVELAAGGVKISAGCRWFTLAQFRAHVASEYPDTDKATETLRILDFIEARASDLGIALEPAPTDGADLAKREAA